MKKVQLILRYLNFYCVLEIPTVLVMFLLQLIEFSTAFSLILCNSLVFIRMQVLVGHLQLLRYIFNKVTIKKAVAVRKQLNL